MTADEFGDPQDKRLLARVNGETMQDSTTAEMIFGVAEIVSFLSHACTLEPGDLILTGTPWGVAASATHPSSSSPGTRSRSRSRASAFSANDIGRSTT